MSFVVECAICDGQGEVEVLRPVSPSEETGGLNEDSAWIECKACAGKGQIETPICPRCDGEKVIGIPSHTSSDGTEDIPCPLCCPEPPPESDPRIP